MGETAALNFSTKLVKSRKLIFSRRRCYERRDFSYSAICDGRIVHGSAVVLVRGAEGSRCRG